MAFDLQVFNQQTRDVMFDEALESLIDAYPNKDSILKGSGASGSGAAAGGGTVGGSLSDCKTEAEKAAFLKAKYGR